MLTLPIDVVPPLQFSGHETFPLRQLWLRKAFDVLSSSEESASRSVFADEDAIARFGVGKNMVAAIKHWSLATEFMEETPAGTYRPTALANSIFDEPGFDPYSEHVTTPWLIHWKLAGVAPRSTTYWWVFIPPRRTGGVRKQLLSGGSAFDRRDHRIGHNFLDDDEQPA